MPFGLNSPIPTSLRSECKKAAKVSSVIHSLWLALSFLILQVLASFVDPRQAFGPDKVIPPQILANAKVCELTIYDVPLSRTKIQDLVFYAHCIPTHGIGKLTG